MPLHPVRTTANTAAEHVSDHNAYRSEFDAPTHTHSGAYEPVVASISVPPAAFVVATGSPAPLIQGGSGYYSAWAFDAAAYEAVSTTVLQVPTSWATFNASLYWSNNGAGAGNVMWRLAYERVAVDGSTLAAGVVFPGAVTVAAPTLGVLKVTTLLTGIAAPAAGAALMLLLERLANDGADTLANDATGLGIRLTRAS